MNGQLNIKKLRYKIALQLRVTPEKLPVASLVKRISCITWIPKARYNIRDSLKCESGKHKHSVPVPFTSALSYIYDCVFWVFLFPHFMWPKFCIPFSSVPCMLHSAPNPFFLILYFWKYTVRRLREERWLRGFENRVIMKIFWSKRGLVVCSTAQQILFGW
jgi:hypothetical protein